MASNFIPGQAAANPSSLVELSVSCRNLLDMDVFSKSDPICVLFVFDLQCKAWRENGRTEIIWDNLNPDFAHKFQLQYFFEEQQRLKFEIYDVDSNSRDLSKHDFLGSIECTLGEIVSTNRIQHPLRGPKPNSGTIILSAEELSSCKEEITLKFCGTKLDKKDFFGKSDPFLVFYKANEDGSYTVTHRSEFIKNTLNPNWKAFTIQVRKLCNGDYDRSLKVECYDWDSDGGHDLIGTFVTSVRELSQGPGSVNTYELINPKKKAKKKKYKDSGVVKLLSCRIESVPSFLDFIKGGTEIHATIAIDFTASNGDPRQPSSLHYYMDPYRPSQYSIALKAVGEIIEDYDTDKLFPALGFGARLPPDGRVSHEFFLNGHPTNPYCQAVTGVMEAYQKALSTVQLYGPTNFAPIINHVARFAAESRDGSGYFILLILTDGVITDLPQTKEAIVKASCLPLSIIIIGVGDADFEAMNVLDGDDVRLSSKGKVAERDIVQFVPMNEFVSKGNSNIDISKARLAHAVLEEVPDQLLSYMKKNFIKPKAALQRLPPLPTVRSSLQKSTTAPPRPPRMESVGNYSLRHSSGVRTLPRRLPEKWMPATSPDLHIILEELRTDTNKRFDETIHFLTSLCERVRGLEHRLRMVEMKVIGVEDTIKVYGQELITCRRRTTEIEDRSVNTEKHLEQAFQNHNHIVFNTGSKFVVDKKDIIQGSINHKSSAIVEPKSPVLSMSPGFSLKAKQTPPLRPLSHPPCDVKVRLSPTSPALELSPQIPVSKKPSPQPAPRLSLHRDGEADISAPLTRLFNLRIGGIPETYDEDTILAARNFLRINFKLDGACVEDAKRAPERIIGMPREIAAQIRGRAERTTILANWTYNLRNTRCYVKENADEQFDSPEEKHVRLSFPHSYTC